MNSPTHEVEGLSGAASAGRADAIASHQQAWIDLALGAAQMGSWEWDVPSQRLRCDARMETFLGLAPGTFGGRAEDLLNLVHPEDRAPVGEVLAAGEDYEGAFRAIWAADGSTHLLRASSKVLRDPQGHPERVIGVAWDLTGRQQIDAQSARDGQLLRALMESIPDKIYFKDTASRFVCVNKAKLAKHGLSDMAEMLGKTDFDFFTRERAEMAFANEQEIIRTGEPLVDHEEKDVWPDERETWVSTTKMPFRDAAGRVIGTFGLSRDITQRKEAEAQLAASTAELRAKNQALEEDLEMARELQGAMLPQRYPCFPHGATPEASSLHFFHYYHPSMSVGGDFFDVLDISDTSAGVFICDVMGHGVRAAMVAATVRAVVGELRSSWSHPAELLLHVNRALRATLQNAGIPLFASAFYMVIDLRRGDLCYANAGHPHALRIHDTGEAPEVIRLNGCKPGPALGLFDEATYTACHTEIARGDTILLFTDGLFEVEGKGGELFDSSLLLSAVSKRTKLPTAELCLGVVEEIQHFSASREFSDDVCLVATKIDHLVGE